MTKPCCVPGCTQPRMINRKGKPLTRCEQHQREYWRSYKTSDKPSYRRRAHRPRAAKAVPTIGTEQSFILIDPATGAIWSVRAVLDCIQRTPADLNAHTLPLLRQGGARIVQISDYVQDGS
ncbi:MAG: hypothetical protein L6Q98_17755 [Anaerolineae bacterium]|nr:hypothetical protein [Anaerolineae bacterium]NUQ05947.1 hypothetical protein [Anaerolineae bacterium]